MQVGSSNEDCPNNLRGPANIEYHALTGNPTIHEAFRVYFEAHHVSILAKNIL